MVIIRNKPEWAGKLIGEMYVHRVTQKELAKKLGLSREYVTMVLSGTYAPTNARERYNAALEEIIKERTVTNDRVTGI